jgi:hypothetical protein
MEHSKVRRRVIEETVSLPVPIIYTAHITHFGHMVTRQIVRRLCFTEAI